MPITARDVAAAEAIYGRDIASMKGKSTGATAPDPEHHHVPKAECKEQRTYCDIFKLRRVNFLLTVVKPLNLVIVKESI